MTSSDKVSVAALISVILRRKINRTIDVKWLVQNDAYAQEIIKLCREQAQDDLTEYADRLDQLTFGKSSAPAPSFAVTESLKAKPDNNFRTDVQAQTQAGILILIIFYPVIPVKQSWQNFR